MSLVSCPADTREIAPVKKKPKRISQTFTRQARHIFVNSGLLLAIPRYQQDRSCQQQ
jgi:hypothetical protein